MKLVPAAFLFTAAVLFAEDPCDNPPQYDCISDCDGVTVVATVSEGETCPPGSTRVSGENQFVIAGGSSFRNITDLTVSASAHGGQPLRFIRRSVTRYFNVEASSPAGSPGTLGSGGNWRHNWQWTILPGVAPGPDGESLIIDYPDGNVRDFSRSSTQDTYLTARSSVSERIEKISATTYLLWFPSGAHLRIEKFLEANNDPYFLATKEVDRHGLEYSMAYDNRRRVTTVTDPAGNTVQLLYGNVGNFGQANVSFSYGGSLAETATKVSIAGDFNGWDTNAHTMNKGADGVWRVTLPLQIGTWGYKIVVTDNGTDNWLLDPANPNSPATIQINGSENSRIDVVNAELNQDASQNQDHTFTFSGSASSVSVAGSFNGWNTAANPMTLRNGVWSTTVSLPPGNIIYKFVVNGSNWQQDTVNPFEVADGYGGFNSSLAIGNVTEALLRVESSLDPAVDYYYDVFSAGPALYATLVIADYGDANPATYTYEAPNFVLNRPRIRVAEDPRYSTASPGARIGYRYRPGLVEGFIQSEFDPLTDGTYLTYDSTDDNIRTITHANGLVETVAVATGNVQGIANPLAPAGESTTFHDGGWGMAASTTDSLNQTTDYTRTYHFGIIKRTDFPGGLYESKTYPDEDKPFFPSQKRDKDGTTETYTRLADGRISRIDRSDGTFETFTYNNRGQILTHRDSRGVTEYRAYDSSSRLVSTRLGSLSSTVGLTEYTYDSGDRKLSETGPAVTTPTGTQRLCKVFSYDSADRRIATTWRLNSPTGTVLAITSTTFGVFGEILSETDGHGHLTTYTYDSQFRKLTETYEPGGLNRITSYEYGELGANGGGCSCAGLNLPTRITSPEGIVTLRAYDTLGRMISETVAPGTSAALATSYTHDLLGRVATVTNPEGMVTTTTYTADGRLETATRSVPGGPSYVTAYAYDAATGRPTVTTRPDGSKLVLTYNANLQLVGKRITNDSGTVVAWKETYAYDAFGRLSTTTDGVNRSGGIAYDPFGRAYQSARPDARTRTTLYDDASLPVSVTGYDGLVTTLRHDVFSRTVSTVHPDGSSSSVYESVPGGQMLSSVSGGVTTTYEYDSAHRPVLMTTGGTVVAYSYEDATRTSSVISAGRATTTIRDAAGRVSAVHRGPAGGAPLTTETLGYSIAQNLLTVTRTTGATFTDISRYDGFGRLSSSTDANGDTVDYAYDGLDRRISYTDAKSATFGFQFDPAGRQTRRTEPDATYQTYTYDAASQLTQHRKADAVILSYTYTSLGQPAALTASASTEYVVWSYDTVGRPSAIENQDVDLQYAYLAASNRLGTETTVVKGLGNLTRTTAIGYDATARLSTLSRAGSFSLGYGYNGSGLISSVTNDSPPPLATYSYDSSGLPTTIQHENGMTTGYTRDFAARITSLAVTDPGNAVVSSVAHTYDAASRRTSATYEDTLGQAYAYDAAGQVKFAKVNIANPSIATASASPTHAFTYDPAGNRSTSLAFGQSTSYVASSVNAYTSISGGGFQPPSPTYDANGNTLNLPGNDGTTMAMAWDIHDRARTFVKGTVTTAAVYDPLGRLTWTRATETGQPTLDEVWSWQSWTLLSRELFSNSAATESFRYTWGPDLSGSLEGAGGVGGLLAIERAAANSTIWEIRHVHPDANGNTLALTTASAQISARYRYSPFGETISSQDTDQSGWNEKNIHRFSTKPEIVGTGLLYYGYRYYDPVTGRWPSRDPIEELGGVNLYSFVTNSPLNQIDQFGLTPSCSNYSKTRAADTSTGWEGRREVQAVGMNPSSNGCGSEDIKKLVPNKFWSILGSIDFNSACDSHDICYSKCGTSRTTCDNSFKSDLNRACDSVSFLLKLQCKALAATYAKAVTGKKGGKSFEEAQDLHCKWECCKK